MLGMYPLCTMRRIVWQETYKLDPEACLRPVWDTLLRCLTGRSTVPLSLKLTSQWEWVVSLAISQVSDKSECEWAHESEVMPTHELKLSSVKLDNAHKYLKRTCEYSQSNLQVLAIELTRTCDQTRQYSHSNLLVLAIICVGNNFCGCVKQSY